MVSTGSTTEGCGFDGLNRQRPGSTAIHRYGSHVRLEPVVRSADERDADAVWPLARDFATSFAPERAVFDGTFHELLARDDTLLSVATADAVVGYLLASTHMTFLANGPVCWIEEVMVAPEHRRLGVGAALMRHAEAWATSRGAAYVSLASRRAGDFYRALDYDDSAAFFRKTLRGR